jgi:aromatic-L-amino-acid decarboxylase
MHPIPDFTLMEEDLDPQDWQAFRSLGHKMIDDVIDYLENLRQRPVWQPVPENVKTNFKKSLPLEPSSPEEVYDEFLNNIFPYPLGNIHPRFWGWVMGTGTPFGVLAELLAATMNPNLAGGDHVANYVEEQVIQWCKEMLGYPQTASGILVSGASMANLISLTVARNTMAGNDLRAEGLLSDPRQMVLYASSEAHSCIKKAVEILGLGTHALHLIPVNSEYEMDLDVLKLMVSEDRRSGSHPFAVVGTAGTVNTGAIDNLDAIADYCQREKLWFHVDGAFGSILAISANLRGMVRGLERADSIALDLHKWLYMPFQAGCALIASEEAHRKAFSEHPDYLARAPRGAAAGGTRWFGDYGIQLTREFQGLKVWMSFKEHGIKKYARMVEQNVRQCQYLVNLIELSPELELLAPAPTNIVCFRYKAKEMNDTKLNQLNQELLMRLHESGVAVPSYTTLAGKYAIRVANTNQRSRREDFQLLVDTVIKLGKEIETEISN